MSFRCQAAPGEIGENASRGTLIISFDRRHRTTCITQPENGLSPEEEEEEEEDVLFSKRKGEEEFWEKVSVSRSLIYRHFHFLLPPSHIIVHRGRERERERERERRSSFPS